jgi:hypothetical protein
LEAPRKLIITHLKDEKTSMAKVLNISQDYARFHMWGSRMVDKKEDDEKSATGENGLQKAVLSTLN